MQTLPTYLEGRKKADFARQIGVSAAQLSQYLSGYRRPSYELMIAIEAATGGEVKVQSWAHMPAHGPASAPAQPSPTKKPASAARVAEGGA